MWAFYPEVKFVLFPCVTLLIFEFQNFTIFQIQEENIFIIPHVCTTFMPLDDDAIAECFYLPYRQQ